MADQSFPSERALLELTLGEGESCGFRVLVSSDFAYAPGDVAGRCHAIIMDGSLILSLEGCVQGESEAPAYLASHFGEAAPEMPVLLDREALRHLVLMDGQFIWHVNRMTSQGLVDLILAVAPRAPSFEAARDALRARFQV